MLLGVLGVLVIAAGAVMYNQFFRGSSSSAAFDSGQKSVRKTASERPDANARKDRRREKSAVSERATSRRDAGTKEEKKTKRRAKRGPQAKKKKKKEVVPAM